MAKQFIRTLITLSALLGVILLMILGLKVLSTRLEYMLIKVYSLYSRILKDHITGITDKINDLLDVLKKTKYYLAKNRRDIEKVQQVTRNFTSPTLALQKKGDLKSIKTYRKSSNK